MFTGIVEEIGTVAQIERGRHSAVFTIRAELVLEDLKIGDSVAVNGICLTVTSHFARGFTADVMHETLNRSALAGIGRGAHVNLERAMPAKRASWRAYRRRSCGRSGGDHQDTAR